MSIGDGQTVWILGAGFSKSLGAPLLRDLFRQEVYGDLRKAIPEDLAARLTWSQALFNYGRDHAHLWEDAEDFLAYIEASYGNPSDLRKLRLLEGVLGRKHYMVIPSQPPTHLRLSDALLKECLRDPPRTVRRALAAETSEFLRFTKITDEQWKPYEAWAKQLNPEWDAVITFNYDTVLESLGDRFHAVLPSEVRKPGSGRVPVFKLHGSSDWIINASGGIERDGEAVEKGADIAIGAPGRGKASLTSTVLKPLWAEALSRLGYACGVAIIGYGFPKTDAEARMSLLAALEMNKGGAILRQIELVLGPDVNLPDARRLLELVRHRTGRETYVNNTQPPPPLSSKLMAGTRLALVTQHPLWAEDFIGDYHRRTIVV